MKRYLKPLVASAFVLLSGLARAQSHYNSFDDGNDQQPWLNLHIVAEANAPEANNVCLCDSIHEYGMGFILRSGRDFSNQNVSCRIGFRFKAETDTQADFVISIDDSTGCRYWNAYPLATHANDTAEWSKLTLNLNFPSDYTQGAEIKGYVWNKGKESLVFDDFLLEVNSFDPPSHQPHIAAVSPAKHHISKNDFIPVVERLDANGDTLSDPAVAKTRVDLEADRSRIIVKTKTVFEDDLKLLRLAFVLPLPDGDITVYRRNQHIDSTEFQNAYYLDREGFAVRNDSLVLSTYHNTGISSLQLNMENRTACFNIDYWRDHPLVHYPMLPDTSDVFEDISYRNIRKGDVLTGEFTLWLSPIAELPRLMPVWDGYQSAFIFTEHADWTDLRTHRAVLFGNEHISKPEDAVGGFCHFGIPVTKSVFYWNPDNVTNEKTSEGLFTEPVASIKTDKDFLKLLKTIKKQGFEICLHSPEIYTTIPGEFPKAMRFMRRNFGTVSWIDHGYNNGPDKNREDMVCDGLLPESPHFAADLWKKNGVRYLWNAYYEENRMEAFNFDGHFVQPYDGFGDALPNRQITTLPDGDKDFRLWATSSTLEVNEDHEWYYYFDSIRLQRLVNHHNVFITHMYPAWTNLQRGAWLFNESGAVVAMPGFNFALGQLARFRDEKKILPTTIQAYIGYYEKLLNIDYQIIDESTISLTNHGEAIRGLTLLCTSPIIVEGKPMDFRKADEGYLVWFDLGKNETTIIKYRK